MKTLYLECNMGAAGDMLTAALLELLPDKNVFLDKINSLGIAGVHVTADAATKCGILGTHMHVSVNGVEEISEDVHHDHEHEHHHHDEHEHHHHDEHEHHHHDEHEHHHHDEHHHHYNMENIAKLISAMPIPENVKTDAAAVYKLIADAESAAHGVPVNEVHFHEVGSLDAVTDVVSCCLLLDMLAPEQIFASAVHVGSGNVKCAHGILPVPAPATAYILKDVPIYGGEIKGELCTPTGAAILKHFVKRFGNVPTMKVAQIGCGMGSKDFPQANCVRAFFGESI